MARVLDAPRFELLDRLVQRLASEAGVTDDVRKAVGILVAAADPERAHQLAVSPDEPSVLIERRAVWALLRADDAAVTDAMRMLDDDGSQEQATTPVVSAASTTGSSRTRKSNLAAWPRRRRESAHGVAFE